MIISAPTALYASRLPTEPTDPTSITFLVSSNDPPRISGYVQTVIKSEELRPMPPKVYSLRQREAALGELIFTVTQPSQKETGWGARSFDIGEVLEFKDSDIEETVNPLEVPAQVDLQHNTNVLDFASMGLSNEEIQNLQESAGSDFNNLLVEFNVLVTKDKDVQVQIQTNQKSINEVRKAINATEVLLTTTGSTGDLDEILLKLKEQETKLVAQRNSLIAEVNELSAQSKIVYNEILKLKEVIP